MWLFTRDGFVSAVQHRDDPDLLLVRARVASHLWRLCEYNGGDPVYDVIETPRADYRFRITVHKNIAAQFVASEIQAIDYDNFKASLPHLNAKHQAYADACSKVWSAMLRLQEPE